MRIAAVIRIAAIIVSVIVAILFSLLPAAADKRVALIVGMSAYKFVTPLDNPGNDARLVAETLRGLGFTLVGDGPQLDLDKVALETAVQNFSRQMQGADVALFYYSGHGLQVRGENFLVPVAANPVREADIDFQLVDANLVLRQMEHAGTKLNVVILDACRNNPFGGRGFRAVSRGLSRMVAPEGTLISYATQPGNVALDGSDGNSPYTKALAYAMRRPGLDIFQTFNEVGLAVMQATGNSQQPWLSSSPIRGRFYFGGEASAMQSSPPPFAAEPSEAERAWTVTKDTTSMAVLEDFIRRFGDSFYVSLARARLEALKKSQAAILAPPTPPPGSPTLLQPTVGIFPSSIEMKPLAAEQERALQPKDAFKECNACPEMLLVPAGSFLMGSPDSEVGRDKDESPQHQVTFVRAFAVGKFAVTFAEWDTCVADGGCNGHGPSDQGWGRDRQPVINVSWDDAKAYVAWLSQRTGKTYRLLSEAEREYVTRAGTSTPFWWGFTITPQQANYDGSYTYNNGPTGVHRDLTVAVDSFRANPWGLYQVHGNVWEWTEDCYNDSYRGAPTTGAAWTTNNCARRVVRGGSWSSGPRSLRAALRDSRAIGVRDIVLGFRVARTITN